MNFKIPSIEEIYNTYHRETMFSMKGFYPKSITNFDKVINDINKEYLLKFQNFIERNRFMINWKLYIKALATYYKNRFDLKSICSLANIKIYRQYIEFLNDSESQEDIKNQIIKSIKYIKFYSKECDMTFMEYFNEDINQIPLCLKDLYSGTVSQYFYAIIENDKLIRLFFNFQDDVFFELFNMAKNDFIDNVIQRKRLSILKYKSIREISDRFNSIITFQ